MAVSTMQPWTFVNLLLVVCFLTITTPQPAKAVRQNGDPKQIKKVHMVFMNHLDVGYDGLHPTVGFALNVVNRYFTQYFPRAVSIAQGLRTFGYREKFIYTTHPWLLYWYLHCTPVTLVSNITLQCPDKSDVDAMRVSVSRGDVVWHAGPMNMEFEVMHPTLLDLSLNFSTMLDSEFGINRTAPVLSQRDVPGMTKAVIPHLKKHNIAAISVGVNRMTSPPALPLTPFIWKLKAEDRDEDGIIAFWHPGGYPENAGAFPFSPGGLSASDCLFAQDVSAFPEVLCFAFRTDNSGPPKTITEVLNNFEIARSQFPNAKVTASTLDQYVSALKASSTSYPIVTQEIGDTWVMGIQSDPYKVAAYRTFANIIAQCFQDGQCSMEDPRVLQSVHYLTKLPEHTWGLDNVNDFRNWTNQDFDKARSGKNYRDCEVSWQEQRQFMSLAFHSLGSHPVTRELEASMKELVPSLPELSGYDRVSSMTAPQVCANGMILQFAPDGSIIKLYEPTAKVDWASENSTLGKVLYATYNQTDYDLMSKLYDYLGFSGAGFTKVNATPNAHPESKFWDFKLQDLYRKKGKGSCDFILKVVPSDLKCVSNYGAPQMFFISYKSVKPSTEARAELDVVVQWFGKGPTRLAEAVSFAFTPVAHDHLRWTMTKLGYQVDPMDVVLNGSQYLHAIDTGAAYADPTGASGVGMEILSHDVALLTLGTASRPPSVFPVPLTPISEPIRTAAFNLFNNLWSTNYIFWYPFDPQNKNFKARFAVKFR